MNAALDRYPGQVAYSFVHFPLPGHRHAVDAARAAECANDAGRFGETLDFIFANQDSLGIRDWTWFAAGAGVADLEGFTECMTDRAIPVTVAMGLALERTMNITGTPAVFLNGWRYPGMPSEAEFLQAIDDLVAGRKPYDKFPEGAIRAQR